MGFSVFVFNCDFFGKIISYRNMVEIFKISDFILEYLLSGIHSYNARCCIWIY